MVKSYNKKVKHRSLAVGDMVLWKVILAIKVSSHSKLVAKWEGPYIISHIAKPNNYYLKTAKGSKLMRP